MEVLHKYRRLVSALKFKKRFPSIAPLGELGSGAGKGGGGGGTIRVAGGAFAKAQVANEETYFKKKDKEQLLNLKEDLQEEIKYHKEQIKLHEEAIKRFKGSA